MSSTSASERLTRRVFVAAASAVAATLSNPTLSATPQKTATMTTSNVLSAKQQAIAPITAAAAVGDMPRLNAALAQGLDAGLTISDTKEMLVQLYAYAGFPRSLNALGELIKVLEARRRRGVQDAPGREPAAPIPTGKELLALGTANQTKLIGAPVRGPLFEFAPAIDEYLKTHLFGDIFARDNLDWQSRELATVGMLASMPGVFALEHGGRRQLFSSDTGVRAHSRRSPNACPAASSSRRWTSARTTRAGRPST